MKKVAFLLFIVASINMVGCGFSGPLNEARDNKMNVYIDVTKDITYEQATSNIRDYYSAVGLPTNFQIMENSNRTMFTIMLTGTGSFTDSKGCFIDFIKVGKKTHITAYNWVCSKSYIENIIKIATDMSTHNSSY